MGVFHPQSMGLGGGFLMTIYHRASGKAEVVDAREVAPAAASETMFVGKSRLTQTGGLAVAVPGEVKGYWVAHQRYGKLPWADLIQPAVNMCLDGVTVSGHLARALRGVRNFVLKEPTLREEFVNPQTKDVYQQGERIVRPKLAKTLQLLAKRGGNDLYEGELAKSLVDDIRKAGGIINAQDLSNYQPIIREALSTILHNNITMYTAPPPGGGPVLAHVLHMLDGFGVHNSALMTEESGAKFSHQLAEALKFAFARRSHLGDPAFVDVNELVTSLMSRGFADQTRHRIRSTCPLPLDSYGVILHSPDDSGTAHVAVLAANGDAVSTTSTINTWLGSGVCSLSTGILLNNEMDDFSSPNITNHFGVPPSPANFIRPGKRPLSSMCPAIFRDAAGDVLLVIGGAGGTRILSSVTQVVMRTLWMGESLKKAIDARRLHHQLLPNELQVEEGFPELSKAVQEDGNSLQTISGIVFHENSESRHVSVDSEWFHDKEFPILSKRLIKRLRNLGHSVSYHSVRGSSVVGIQRTKDGNIYASSDFRKDGGTAGY